MSDASLPTIVYVDGFNLFYGALKGTQYKWLDLNSLATKLLEPKFHHIVGIKYFTARVRQRYPGDSAPTNQSFYLRALATDPLIRVYEGTFTQHVVSMPLPGATDRPPIMVDVVRVEEKGSDVALATALVADSYEGNCAAALVITNDSDQVPPIRLVRARRRLTVGVAFPRTVSESASRELREAATFVRHIRPGQLATSQFPAVMSDSAGTFHRPPSWSTHHP